ncbi:MAG: alpha-ribazole phosphatase family protein [Gammaproteobacteria bacterium]
MTGPRQAETCIDLLRHGEPVGGSRYRGQLDDPLSEKGWEQMWHSVSAPARWDRIITSPLQRCRAFADALAEQRGLPVHCEPRFSEVGFGDWEGKTRAELDRLDPKQLSRFYQDPLSNRPPGAEPLDVFTARVSTAFSELLAQFPRESLLVITHAGVIRAIMAHVLEVPPVSMYRIHVANAGMSRIRTDSERLFSFISHGMQGK